ncbi:MAG: LysM peptidoglycan-binding domain-containing protein [Spirochaetaceae bacterium]|jgi:membrane-bound lytic murein transglycosylase D|nr:LysM peptidoglycan-binding domain-containing protein [Spirochaetaceae bacterium]
MKRLAGRAKTKVAALFVVLGIATAEQARSEIIGPEYTGQGDAPSPMPTVFYRPLRKRQTPIPVRIIQQQSDRKRSIVLPEINGVEHALTKDFIKRYTTYSGLRWLVEMMRNAEPYLAFVRNEIESRELPPELLYLPVIESGYNSSARSRSGAVGLWQFMQNSIRPYMVITDYHDERMDFWKSTHGALSKLKENHTTYKDWALALAAYNSGGGAITRLLQRTGIRDYWVLAETRQLKYESIYYVPKLLAVHYIVSNPRKFGLDISWKPTRVEWTRLQVNGQADIRLIAEHAGVDRDEMFKMNRELHSQITPPGGYMLKVRKTDAEAVRAVLENADIDLIRVHYHRIKSGDTLSALARQYGVTVDQIVSENPGIKPRALRIGSTLRLPTPRGSAQEPPKAAATQGTGWSNVWVVRSGDTLWSIAQRHGVSTLALARANEMSTSEILRIGRRLKVP